MTPSVDDLVAGRRGARQQVVNDFARCHGDREAAGDLLDELAGSAASCPAALEVLVGLVQRHRLAQPAIRRLIVDEDDVEDVEQSVLAIVALRVGQFRADARFTTWLHRIASNEAKTLLRSRAARPVLDPRPLPEVGYLARLSSLSGDRDVIERALAAVPARYRDLLVARERDQLDYGELARRFDIPIGTVRSRLHRSRELLAAALAGQIDDPAAGQSLPRPG